jgi:hypothetical protein
MVHSNPQMRESSTFVPFVANASPKGLFLLSTVEKEDSPLIRKVGTNEWQGSLLCYRNPSYTETQMRLY